MALLQRRALRIAFHYLRDAADADEAVQDAFVKVFLHIEQYRDDLPFDVWFTRILVNASLDRLKARTRQHRLVIAGRPTKQDQRSVTRCRQPSRRASSGCSRRSGGQRVSRAVAALAGSAAAGVHAQSGRRAHAGRDRGGHGNEPGTVRVHLFRALRKLRGVLGEEDELARRFRSQRRRDILDAYRAAARGRSRCRSSTSAPLEAQRHADPGAGSSRLGHRRPGAARFPGAAGDHAPSAPVPAAGWISAAAAAGLIIGLLTGQLLHVIPGDNWSRADRGPLTQPVASPRRALPRPCLQRRSIRITRFSTPSMPPWRGMP